MLFYKWGSALTVYDKIPRILSFSRQRIQATSLKRFVALPRPPGAKVSPGMASLPLFSAIHIELQWKTSNYVKQLDIQVQISVRNESTY